MELSNKVVGDISSSRAWILLIDGLGNLSV